MSSKEKEDLQLTAKTIIMKQVNRPRDIYMLSNKNNNRLTYQKLQHDSESEGEDDRQRVGAVNGESGSQPIVFPREVVARDSSETLVDHLQRPPSPTL